jgi:hypothetical protein
MLEICWLVDEVFASQWGSMESVSHSLSHWKPTICQRLKYRLCWQQRYDNFVYSIPCIKACFMKQPTNTLMNNIVVYWPHLQITEQRIGEYQCGFRRNRSTKDQIFVVRQIIEKHYEHDSDVHLLFIDYKSAFDSVNIKELIESMYRIGVSKKLVKFS